MPAEGALDLPSALELPPARVRVDAARAAEFSRETGFDAGFNGAPLCYPAVWLTTPAIHGAIEQICARAESVPVHESQHFAYETPLRVGEDYDLSVSMRREEKPPRLVVEALLATLEGVPVGRFETLLRLVPRDALRRDKGA
ncbi:MAG: hypothetical protein WB816_17895 [Methylocystis sp.]